MKLHLIQRKKPKIYVVKALTEDYHFSPSNLEKELRNEVLLPIYFLYGTTRLALDCNMEGVNKNE